MTDLVMFVSSGIKKDRPGNASTGLWTNLSRDAEEPEQAMIAVLRLNRNT